MSSGWFYKLMGNEFGPVSSEELRELADNGTIDFDTPIGKGTTEQWVVASRVGGLFVTPTDADEHEELTTAGVQNEEVTTGGQDSKKTGCAVCGKRRGIVGVFQTDLSDGSWTCDTCLTEERKAQSEKKHKHEQAIRKKAASVLLTTTPTVQGYVITHYWGIDSVELVLGTGAVSETVSDVQDFFGARSSMFEGKLREAKDTTIKMLKRLAVSRGANAVVGIDMDFVEFSRNRIGVVLNGTFVTIEPESA